MTSAHTKDAAADASLSPSPVLGGITNIVALSGGRNFSAGMKFYSRSARLPRFAPAKDEALRATRSDAGPATDRACGRYGRVLSANIDKSSKSYCAAPQSDRVTLRAGVDAQAGYVLMVSL